MLLVSSILRSLLLNLLAQTLHLFFRQIEAKETACAKNGDY